MGKTSALVWLVLPLVLAGCATGRMQHDSNSIAAHLEMKVRLVNLDELKSSNLRKGTQLCAEIRNVGTTTVWLPTEDIGPMVFGSEGGSNVVLFSPDGYISTTDGFRVPKAKSNLGIVELRPGEAGLLNYIFSEPPAVVIVKYKISKEFGKRYGVWHGEIITENVR